jgi:hypothetical protein
MLRSIAIAVALSGLATAPAGAQELIAAYVAEIGRDDLYNSRGERLTQPWQVLRQDRANFHRFGIRQPGDEWDPLFGDAENRAAMERMVMRGRMDPAAARAILQGDAMVRVEILGRGGRGESVIVTVWR